VDRRRYLPAEKRTKIVKSICPMCLKCCGLDAHVKNGELVKVTAMKEHPFNRLCVKAGATIDWLYSKERITHPLKKAHQGWEEISWDEAFEAIAAKLEGIKKNYGAKALVVNLGNPFIGNHVPMVAKRFCSLYGTPNYTSGASVCFAAKGIGHGLSLSSRMLPLFPSFTNTRCVIVWGTNPEQCDVNQARDISLARRQGAKLVVIDPRKIPLAEEADIYAQIRPGTDGALALGLLNVIVGEELYDKEFVENWTAGFDKLREHIIRYSPEVIERITWVPAETTRQIARTYSASIPATITQGVSLDHCTSGVETSRAISILIAITGNLDARGGNTYSSPLKQASLRIKGNVSLDEAIGVRYPIFGKFTSETTSMPVPDAVVTERPYPVKALIIQGSNPVLTWPNAKKVIDAFKKLDLLVVSDLFMTETAKFADIFLPAATFFEEEMLKDYTMNGLPLIALGNKAVELQGNCLEDWKIWAELGKKMGYASYFPWQSADELFNTLLEPTGITLDQLKRKPGGIVFHELGQKDYLKRGLATLSGKVEIFSQIMADHGYNPPPTFTNPAENLISQPALEDEYPFLLISGTRVGAYTHSRFRNIKRLRKLAPEPLAEINSNRAKEMGIGNDDMVLIESPEGRIKLKAKLTQDIHTDVVSIQHGWKEANANILTSDEVRDPISAYPVLKAAVCRVAKAG
jgi:anaerobic selenocysteine-containing dehydrogenase